MSPSLSANPDLAQIKRQAKELLTAQKVGDPVPREAWPNTMTKMFLIYPRLESV